MILVSLALTACDSLKGAPLSDHDPVPEMEGFVYIKAAGKKVRLGTDDPTAPLKERPSMEVEFTYNYYIGQMEVDCFDHYNMMVRDSYVFPCMDDNMPVANLTFFDAVLYANALSKRKHMDTAYTYVSAIFDVEGHCVDLEGFKFIPEAEAFRLPTEAEWVYAATPGWDPTMGWTSDLSNEIIYHPRGVKPANWFGIYDMAGNVMEWVNDWFGYFRDTTLTNYVGAINGGSFGERVVKGGSVRNEAANINLHSRAEVYTVTSSSKSIFVGLRLAYGPIPDATWLSANGATNSNSSSIVSGSAKVKSMTGSFRTKLAFRNDATGNLSYVDYSFGALQIIEVVDTMEVFHPDISPNGKKVAFSTRYEGIKGPSSIYVRDLNATGSNLVKLDVESASIPRWRVLPNGDTVIVYVTGAGDNTLDANFDTTSTWQVPFSNGQFGTPVKFFDGGYHGGVSPDDRLAVSGSKIFRARKAGTSSTLVDEDALDTVWLEGDQICNVSLSGGSDKRSMFLDFAGKYGTAFAGADYEVHGMLFVADSSGNIIQAVPSPADYTFDHSEWIHSGANQKDLAVVSLTNDYGAHTKIGLVDLADGTVMELIEGEELWHPCLWIKPQDPSSSENDILLALDSVAIYYDNAITTSEGIMKPKMRMFWEMKDSLELVAVGSSRTERGFDPFSIPSYVSLNMGYSGSELWGELYFAENYVLNHVKNLKVLVLELPPDLQSNAPEVKYNMLFEQAPGYIYDANHDFWVNGLPEDFMMYVQEYQEYSEEENELYVKTLGLFREDARSWKGKEVDRDSIFTDKEMAYYESVMANLDGFIERTADKGFKIVLVVYPQSPGYAQTGSFGRHGLRRSIAMETMKHYREMEQKYPHLIFMDENNMGDHEYTDDMATDFDHLCTKGAQYFTQKLDSLLKALE